MSYAATTEFYKTILPQTLLTSRTNMDNLIQTHYTYTQGQYWVVYSE